MIFAHLMHTQMEAILEFLTSVPGPTGKPALEFVLLEWCSRQHLFFGAYERKVRYVICLLTNRRRDTITACFTSPPFTSYINVDRHNEQYEGFLTVSIEKLFITENLGKIIFSVSINRRDQEDTILG